MTLNILGNIRALLPNVDQDFAIINIKAHIIKNKSNGAACVTDNLLIVYIGLGGNLSKDHNHVSLGACFTCNLAIRVLSEASIKHCIGDLVTQLVEMTLIYKLRSEYEGLHSFKLR